MLVLTRKKGESIMINGDISVTVLGVEGDTVKLGIVAPTEVAVFRSELYESIQRSNKQAIVNPNVDLHEIKKFFKGTEKGD